MIDFWYSVARIAAIAFGILVGSLAVAAACYVWIKRQMFGLGGSGLCGCGVVLLGLSIWQSIDFNVSSHGITLKAAKELAQSNQTAVESAQRAATAADASATAAANAASASQSEDAKTGAAKAAREAAAARAALEKAVKASEQFKNVIVENAIKF